MNQNLTFTLTKSDDQDTTMIDTKSTFLDILLFLCLVGLSSNFFGIVDPAWFYLPGLFDFRMLFVIFSALLLIFMLFRWQILLSLPAGVWLLFIAAYVAVQFIFSASQFGFTDAFKVFRYYCLPIVSIGPLLYTLTLPKDRQLRLIRWVFIATILQGIFYIMHHLGFSIFYSQVHTLMYFGAGEVQRYNHAFPPYTLFVMNAALLFIFFQNEWHHAFYVIVLASVIILYATRSLVVIAAFSMVFLFGLALFKQGGKTLARIGIIALFIMLGGVLFMMLFPQYPEFLAERFLEITGPEGLRSAPNYNKRMLMVEIATYDMATLKQMLFGHGYEFRLLYDYLPGNLFTELSMQGDAPMAGLLFTEGFVGVFLRAMPFIIFLFTHMRLFLKSESSEDLVISSLVIVTISGIALTWLQTTALRDIPFSLLPIVLLHSLHSCNKIDSVCSDKEFFESD